MTNKSNVTMNADGPPQKRRRTQIRKSPKNQPNTLIVPPSEQPAVSASSSSSIIPSNPRREKKPKSTHKKEVDLQRKREEVQPTTERCSDYLSDKWKPDFRSTYPLAKSLERRRVLVDYIHLVKRISARKDKVEAPPKRPSVLQPQTIEELEKEIDKCTNELDKLARQRDENSDLKKNLMARYKALYREEDEERKKLQIQEEKRVAELAQSSELEKLILTMAAAQSGGVLPGDFMQSLAAMSNPASSAVQQNSILQAQQNLLAAAAASGIQGVDIAQYLNNLSQMSQLQSLTPNTQSNSADIRSQSAVQKHSPAVTTPNRTPQSNLMTPNSSNLNMFHAMSSTQNPFASQSNAGLLTQQAQGGLVSQPQSQSATQHLLHNSAQQSQRSSPNIQAANLIQQQNPFLATSNPNQNQNQSQNRPQSAFPSASQASQVKQQQLDFQNMLGQWNASQGGVQAGLNTPQAKAILANIQQERQRQLNAHQQQLQAQKQMELNQEQSQTAIYQALQQNILAKNQQMLQAQKQNLLSTGTMNTGSRQSPLATTSYANQQTQLNRKQSAVNAVQQQAQLQNRLQIPQNLTGRSATPQFAVPNLPASSQPKVPPRAQSTRPPINFAVSSVIASTSSAQPSQSIAQQVQQNANLQAMFQQLENPAAAQQQIQAQQQEAILNQLNSSLGGSLGASMTPEQQQNLMVQMFLMAQAQQMPK